MRNLTKIIKEVLCDLWYMVVAVLLFATIFLIGYRAHQHGWVNIDQWAEPVLEWLKVNGVL